MSDIAENIQEDKKSDVVITVENISPDEDPVDCYVFGTDPMDEDVRVTVFEDNLPGVDFQRGETYRIIDGLGEVWDDDIPGIKILGSTNVNKLESTEILGNEIKEGEIVDIALQVENIQYQDKPDISYYAWCQDELGETVIATVFEDNKPKRTLEVGQWYEFSRVKGERWDDGTPGIKFTYDSEITPRQSEPESDQKVGVDSLVIDSVSPEHQSVDSSPLLDRPYLGVILTGLATAIAIASSLFAPEFGPLPIIGIIVVGTLVATSASYYTNYNPASKLRQRRRQMHLRLYLELLIRDYKRKVDKDVDVRANVMTVDQSRFGSGSPTLSIFSCTEGYKDSEKQLNYSFVDKEGNYGRSYVDGEVKVYDSEQYPETEADLTPQQRELTGETDSILSVPIFVRKDRDKNPSGVLNLDSELHVKETKFDADEIQNFVHRYADVISDVLR